MPFLKHSCFFLFLPVIMSNISLITLIFLIFYFFILPNSENKNCPRSCICLIIMSAFSLAILSITMASAFMGASHLDIPLPPMSHSIQVNIYTIYAALLVFPTFITPAFCQFKTAELILASLSLF